MKSFSVLLIKDLRAVRGWIVVIWVFLVSMLLCPQRGAIGKYVLGWPETASWLSVTACCILIFMQRALLKVDPPRGDDRFIGTRPVRGGAVFASKLAAILVGGIVPVCLTAAMRISAAELGVTWSEAGTLALENAWIMLSFLGLLSLRYVIPGDSMWSSVLGGIVALPVLGILAVIMGVDAVREPFNWILAVLFTLGIPCWVGLAARYGRWRGWLRMLAIPGAWLVAAWMNVAWHQGTPPPLATSSMKAVSREDPRLTCSQMLPWTNLFLIESTVTFTDLPRGTWAEPMWCEGTFRHNGEASEQHFSMDTRAETPVRIPIWAAGVATSFGSSAPDPVNNAYTFSCPIGRIWLPASDGADEKGKRIKTFPPFTATLRGVYHIDLYRAELEKQLPVARGTEWHGHHQALWIQDVAMDMGPEKVAEALRIATGSDIIAHNLRMEIAADTFRASGTPFGIVGMVRDLGAEYGFFLINEPRKILMGVDSYMGNVSNTLLLRRHQFSDNAWSFRGEHWSVEQTSANTLDEIKKILPLDHRQSKLGVFRKVKVGTMSVPFEYIDYHFDPQMNAPGWR